MPSVRELFRLRVIEYQNGVSTEARALTSQLAYLVTLKCLKENGRCLMKTITARDLQNKVKEMRGCLSTRPGCGRTPRQTSRRVGDGRRK